MPIEISARDLKMVPAVIASRISCFDHSALLVTLCIKPGISLRPSVANQEGAECCGQSTVPDKGITKEDIRVASRLSWMVGKGGGTKGQ
jgi:hypothetical protein